MKDAILEFLERVADIPYWDREPGINNETLNEMINFLRKDDNCA